MIVVGVIAMVLFGAGALCALYRIVRGPSVLDRAVASDVLVVIVMCALGTDMALNHHTHTLAILLVLGLVGFISSLAIARFVPKERRR